MTKNVLVSIAGMHYGVDDESGESEPLEVITPATYYFKNNKHYILYDEVVEGMIGTTKNTIKIAGDNFFEMSKSGLTNSKMTFEKDRIYTEQEVNETIQKYHEDYCTLRRDMISEKMMKREGTNYQRI